MPERDAPAGAGTGATYLMKGGVGCIPAPGLDTDSVGMAAAAGEISADVPSFYGE